LTSTSLCSVSNPVAIASKASVSEAAEKTSRSVLAEPPVVQDTNKRTTSQGVLRIDIAQSYGGPPFPDGGRTEGNVAIRWHSRMSAIDGWYLMTNEEVVREVERWKADPGSAFRDFSRLPVSDALSHRNAGNFPDDEGRSLRLVITVDPDAGVDSVSERRLEFEPDFHHAPNWRRPASRPVNLIPLRMRTSSTDPEPEEAWWEDEKVAPLEAEWKEFGTVAGLPVPGEFRSFVFKTVIALRASGRDVTADSVADSVARWLDPVDADRLRKALQGGPTAD
jgi:hypothetical protein